MDVANITDIAVKTGRQNMADCRRLRQSRNWSLVAESVEIGKRV